MRSIMRRTTAPMIKPISGGSHFHVAPTDASAISIAGANRLQKLAAIITPAAIPSEQSRYFWEKFLLKSTREAPIAVTPHVPRVAIRACMTGFNS